jgi:hypothetical protein
MIKNLKSYHIISTPFDTSKEWVASNVDNSELLLTETESPEEAFALEFVDYGSGYPYQNSSCDIALENQDADIATVREGQKVTGIFYPEQDPANYDGTYKRSIYAQVKSMFYNDYRDITKVWGAENIDFEKSDTKKYPAELFRIIDIPFRAFGEKILEDSVQIYDNSINDDYVIVDDGRGNLVASSNLFSKVQKIGTFDIDFQTGISNDCSDYFDFIPPSGSILLLVTTSSITQSVLNWNDPFSNEVGFIVERSIDSGSNWSILKYLGENAIFTIDSAVSSGQSYWYRVYGYNGFGSSSYSNTASVSFSDTSSVTGSSPGAPSSLSVISGSAILSWSDNSDNEDGFGIERSTDGIYYSYLNEVGDNIEEYTDSSVESGNSYWYRVFSFNTFGSSSYSNTASIEFAATGSPETGSSDENVSLILTNGSSTGSFLEDIGLIIYGNMPNVTSLTINDTSSFNGYDIELMTDLESVYFPNLINVDSSNAFFYIVDCPNLTTLSMPKYLPADGTTHALYNNNLDETSVNSFLARCVANVAYVNGSIDLSGGTNAAPTGQGIADVSTLIGRGVSVSTN